MFGFSTGCSVTLDMCSIFLENTLLQPVLEDNRLQYYVWLYPPIKYALQQIWAVLI